MYRFSMALIKKAIRSSLKKRMMEKSMMKNMEVKKETVFHFDLLIIC